MKRRKKYNPHKQTQLVTKSVLANTLIIWHTFGDQKAELYHRNGRRIKVNQAIQTAVTEYRYKWSLLIAAFGKDSFGKLYMKSEIVLSQEPYTHAELCDFLNVQHKKIIEGMNEKHFIGAGWLASIAGNDLTEADAFKWFEKVALNEFQTMPQMPVENTGTDSHAIS